VEAIGSGAVGGYGFNAAAGLSVSGSYTASTSNASAGGYTSGSGYGSSKSGVGTDVSSYGYTNLAASYSFSH